MLMEDQGKRRFEVRQELGRGGMGAVYEAFDRERQEPVAVKMLLGCDPDVIVNLKQEFRSLCEIAHPQLISMYELLCEDDQWFFTMELVRDGQRFMAHLRDAPTPVSANLTAPPASDATVDTLLPIGNQIEAPVEAPVEAPRTALTPPRSLAYRAEPATFPGQLPQQDSNDAAPTLDGDSPGFEQAVTPAGMLAPAAEHEPAVGTHTPTPARVVSAEELDRTLDLFHQLAQGVHALHGFGKLHRDLKPANVMVRADGTVIILDFGLAIAKGRSERTAIRTGLTGGSSRLEGSISGTPLYMSPEQTQGRPLTEASDWYAVGTMLFEALTGEPPFHGDALAILRRKQREPAPDLAERVRGVPPELVRLCNRLLARDPAERPSGAEVLATLSRGNPPSEPVDAVDAEPAFIGRASLLQTLRRGFEESRSDAVLIELHGRSGSGKTALMEHFLESLENRAPLVFYGRCYEQESVPYKTLDGVADGIAAWLADLSSGLQQRFVPANVHALAKIFPTFLRVKRIATEAAAAPASLDLTELRRMAFDAFGELLAHIGTELPMIVCIDDLQWGDPDGIAMLEAVLARSDLRGLVLATYRDEYLETSPALRAFTAMKSRAALARFRDAAVEPLGGDEALELLRQIAPEESTRLGPAELDAILRQAAGNPYFLSELARRLRAGTVTAGPAEFSLDEVLWSRIGRLPAAELQVLELIAVSGQPIRLRDVQSASELEHIPQQVLTSLRMHRLVRSDGLQVASQVQTYHDRIRETVLSHLEPARRRGHHVKLAECLEAGGESTPDTLAMHFEMGDVPEKASGYYELAATGAAQALAFGRAEEFFRKASKLTQDGVARARIAERLVHLYTDLARFPEAYATGREALARLGMELPPRFFPPGLLLDLARHWRLMRGRAISELRDLPRAADQSQIARMQMLSAMGKAAYQIRPELCIAILLKLVNSCLVGGNNRDAAIGYMAVGTIFFGGILGRYQAGYEYGQVALDLVEKYDATRIRAEVSFVVGYFGTSWRRPALEAERLWQKAQAAGRETGDLFHVGCASCATVMSQWMRGRRLEELDHESGELLELVRRYGLKEPRFAIEAVRAGVNWLRTGEDGFALPEDLESFGSRHFAHYGILLQMQRHYLEGRWNEAIAAGQRSARFLADSRGMLHSAEHSLYLSLAQLARAQKKPLGSRVGVLVSTAAVERTFRRWAAGSPANFAAKALLLQAERKAAAKALPQALTIYSSAAEAAVRYDHPHVAALARQRAAAAAMQQGDRAASETLLADAATLYRAWGAGHYAEQLETGHV